MQEVYPLGSLVLCPKHKCCVFALAESDEAIKVSVLQLFAFGLVVINMTR